MTIPIYRVRKLMGKAAEKYTDSQLEEVVNTLTVLADLAIDSYLGKQGLREEGPKAHQAN